MTDEEAEVIKRKLAPEGRIEFWSCWIAREKVACTILAHRVGHDIWANTGEVYPPTGWHKNDTTNGSWQVFKPEDPIPAQDADPDLHPQKKKPK